METKLNDLLNRPVGWLADAGPDDDIAISTRIRLARNFQHTPFPVTAKAEALCKVRDFALKALESSDSILKEMVFPISELNETDRQFLLERRLISRDFMKGEPFSTLVSAGDESLAVMINEEDHLRIQALSPGFQLAKVWERIDAFDNILSRSIPYAFDEKFGYLTSCPSNLGTGMRASVMLHLPGLVLAGQIAGVAQAVGKLGLAIRGFYGEASENLGNLFQISNQSTLGESESTILERLSSIITQIIIHEKKARGYLMEQKQNFLLNHIGRAYGILRHGYLISSEDALNSLSALRLGVDMGMFSSVDLHTVNELFMLVQPSHLMLHEMKQLNSEERDAIRAAIIREKLKAKREP